MQQIGELQNIKLLPMKLCMWYMCDNLLPISNLCEEGMDFKFVSKKNS